MRPIDFYASNDSLCVQSTKNSIFLGVAKLGYGSKAFLYVRDLSPLGLGPFLALSLEISESYNCFSEIFKNWLQLSVISRDRQGMVPDPVAVGPEHE